MSLVRIQIITQRLKEMFSKIKKGEGLVVYCVVFFFFHLFKFQGKTSNPFTCKYSLKNFT